MINDRNKWNLIPGSPAFFLRHFCLSWQHVMPRLLCVKTRCQSQRGGKITPVVAFEKTSEFFYEIPYGRSTIHTCYFFKTLVNGARWTPKRNTQKLSFNVFTIRQQKNSNRIKVPSILMYTYMKQDKWRHLRDTSDV